MSSTSIPQSGRPSRAQRARTLSYLFLAGSVIGVAALTVLPLPGDTSIAGTTALVVVTLVVGLALYFGGSHAPAWAIPVVLSTGSLVVSADIYFAGRSPTSDEMFYVWIAFYAAYFLNARAAAAQIGLLAAGYAAALALRHEPDGSTRWVIVVGTLALASLLTRRLVSQLDRYGRHASIREQALRQAQERFRSSFENAAIGMAMVDLDGRWTQVNQALADLLGYSRERLVGMRFRELTPEVDVVEDLEALKAMVEGRRTIYQTEKRYRRADGSLVWVALNVSMVRDDDDRPLHMISQMQDITERRAAEQELIHRAVHDPLTGLPNRTLFVDRAQVALARMQREAAPLTVLFLDIDRFKLVNDSLGHAAGDELLVQIGERLSSLLRPSDTVARFGGDEFTVLCEGTDEREASVVAERIAESLAQPFGVSGKEVFVSASIGISITRDTGADAETLLSEADAAMYRAKETGRSRHAIFDGGMRLRGAERLALENELRRAIAEDELRVHYQPQVMLDTGQVYGLEALVRWQHPQRGLLGPGEFISVAEDSGLIVPLGEWVMRAACLQVRDWRDRGVADPSLCVAVNVSARQLADEHFCEVVAHALRSSGLDPAALQVELTETTAVDVGLPMLEEIKGLGVKLALDDFGVGFSSLNQIRRMPPVDMLKIDRSFVIDIALETTDQAIVAAIIGMAKSLSIQTLAEGIETADQIRVLRRLGCDRGQGYHFARPARPSPIEELLQSAAAGELLAT